MVFLDSNEQHQVYKDIVDSKRKTSLFSCGYYERYDPFLLDKKPFMFPVFEKLFDEFFPEKAGNVLDLGCGTCFYWPLLVKHCFRLEGLDYSSILLSEAQKLIPHLNNARVNLKQGSGDVLPYESNSFDTVIALDVLHHIPNLAGTLIEIKRVLKPNGIFFNLEPNMINPVMLLAHIIPSEERRAIIRNWPWVLKSKYKKYFQSVEVEFTNVVVSADSEKTTTFLKTLDNIFSRVPILESFNFRMLLKAYK